VKVERLMRLAKIGGDVKDAFHALTVADSYLHGPDGVLCVDAILRSSPEQIQSALQGCRMYIERSRHLFEAVIEALTEEE